MTETVFTDLDDVPFAVKFDPNNLSYAAAALKGNKMRVQPSDDHPWTYHTVEEIEEQDDGSVLVRLSRPLDQ